MERRIEIKPYARRFRQPLRTARGEWSIREGFLLRLESEDSVGYGEVAPLPEFGSETLAQARACLESLQRDPAAEVPEDCPCCAFALSAAAAEQLTARAARYRVSGLLPAGAAALDQLEARLAAGYESLKWKIGVLPEGEEQALAERLLERMPEGVGLRLDANAGLSPDQLERWLGLLEKHAARIDYLEQPLAVGEEDLMADAMARTAVPIALDESLNGPRGARFFVPGIWAGPLVVKPCLMGDVAKLRAKLEGVAEQVVFSSVFETGVGLANCLALAAALPELPRPIGFDTVDAFEDALNPAESGPEICGEGVSRQSCKQIWASL